MAIREPRTGEQTRSNELKKIDQVLLALKKVEKYPYSYQGHRAVSEANTLIVELVSDQKKFKELLGDIDAFEKLATLITRTLPEMFDRASLVQSITKNLPIIATHLNQRSVYKNKNAAYDLLGACLKYMYYLPGGKNTRTKISDFFWKNNERLIKDLFEGGVEHAKKPLAYFFTTDSSERSDELEKKLKEKFKHSTSLTDTMIATAIKWSGDGGYLNHVGGVLISQWLDQLGLDKKIFDGWASVEFNKTLQEEYIERNIRTIMALEKKVPSSTRTLWKEFGIQHFARYPVDVLLRQYHSREDTTKPYGVAIIARNDWLGSFTTGHAMWSDFEKQLSTQGYLLRISEVSNKIELLRRLITHNRRYGNDHKISFMLLGSHGSNDYLELGENTDDNSIELVTKDQLKPTHIKQGRLRASPALRAKKFFTRIPSVVLWACSTGEQEDGIASQLSKSLIAEVSAPHGNSWLEKIRVIKEGEQLHLIPRYGSPYQDGDEQRITYKNGKKVFDAEEELKSRYAHSNVA